ncbi:MAG: hypothetical protein IIY32_09760, partial [Thermoguttaceae bacterium]|nr:hypothetical protein [Thermoguttaceae bacterium]
EAIALRPDFNKSPKKFAKDVAVTSTRVQLFNRMYQLQPRGCELEVRSNHGELDLSFDCIDRLFVITGQSEDGKAKVVFALLIEST